MRKHELRLVEMASLPPWLPMENSSSLMVIAVNTYHPFDCPAFEHSS